VARDDKNVMFGKKTESRVHTFLVIAFSRELNASPSSRAEFLELARDFKAAGVERDRIEMLEEEFLESSDPAPDCARYRMRSRDRGASIAKGVPLSLEQAGVICLHPVSHRHLVDVRYSERGGPEPPSAQLREEGEAFLRSLEFTPVN
jgi:hypothetical protein